jgi:hypothetical protein
MLSANFTLIAQQQRQVTSGMVDLGAGSSLLWVIIFIFDLFKSCFIFSQPILTVLASRTLQTLGVRFGMSLLYKNMTLTTNAGHLEFFAT